MVFRIAGLCTAVATVLLIAAAVAGGPLQAQEGGADPRAAPAGGQGSKIAFQKTRENYSINRLDPTTAEIWVMDEDGSDPIRLTENETEDLAAAWSPDGETLAFYSVERDGPRIHLINDFSKLPIVNGADQTPEPFKSQRGRFPSWSPDGKKIAFDNGGQFEGDVFVINDDGGRLKQLTFDPLPNTPKSQRNIRPDWSPDGKKIAFTSRRNGNDEIYVMDADGTNLINLTNNGAADNAPNWSPKDANGDSKIVFQSNRGGNVDIYVMNADGTAQTRLTTFHGRDLDPDWSPDGTQIAFDREIEDATASPEPITTSDGVREVFVMDAKDEDGPDGVPDGNGDSLKQLTQLPSENGHPGWGFADD